MDWVRKWVDGIVDKKLYPVLYGDGATRSAEPLPTGHRVQFVGSHKVRCLSVVPRTKAPRKTAVYFHGNAVTLSDLACSGWIQSLSDALEYHILCPDYANARSAHGRNLDTHQVLHAQDVIAATVLDSPHNPVVVMGRSLGCAIALRAVAEAHIDIAKHIDHVHLVSPFASLDALLPAWALKYGVLTSGRFNSVDAVQKLAGNTHLSVYHGTKDNVINYDNAVALNQARAKHKWHSARNTLDTIVGMGHDPLPYVQDLVHSIQEQASLV